MQKLKLRTVGTRHVASDGTKDVGEFDEAHFRAYVASLPGSYETATAPDGSTAAGRRPGQMPGPQSGGNVPRGGMSRGEARQEFTRAVETDKRRLLSEDASLTELEAHRLAADRIAKANPSLLAAYRMDIEEI